MVLHACRRLIADPRGPLAVTALAELLLCVGFFRERWNAIAARSPEGAGLVVRSDGLGYYAWLRSLLVDGDWHFDNEFDEHNPIGDYVPPSGFRTPAGRRPNPWSVGPACVWAVTVVPAQLVLQSDGYAAAYQLLVAGTTLLASWLGLGFLYGLCRHDAEPGHAALTAALLTLSTSLVYYNTIEPSMGHALGTVAVAGLVWYWRRTFGSLRPGRWFLVGLLLGIAALMRWQLVTLAVLPLGELVLLAVQRQRTSYSVLSTLTACGFFVGFLPQMIAWRVVYGDWLVTPMTVAHHWLRPALGQVLLAHDRGFFYWTPLSLLACFGYLRQRDPSLILLAVAFMGQVYAVASVHGEGVYLGVAFGFRQLTEAIVLLAPGLALLLKSRRVALLACLFALWNLLLVAQYRYGLLPAGAGADPATLLASAGRFIVRKRFDLLGQVVLAPALLAWYTLRSARQGCEGLVESSWQRLSLHDSLPPRRLPERG
jgi:hypothetical protein